MANQATEGKLSPFLRERRFQAAIPFLRGRVLDLGAGGGGLALFVDPDNYLGVERDARSLKDARTLFPSHSFTDSLEGAGEFDTVVSLAVIEHAADPSGFLSMLNCHLKNSIQSRIVITTPHPAVDWVHGIGAKLGLFSSHASEEHEALLGHRELLSIGEKNNLVLTHYQRFLFGANQLAIYKRKI